MARRATTSVRRGNQGGAVEAAVVPALSPDKAADRRTLISSLEAIQNEHGYLPEAALRELSARTQFSLLDIYGVASFYRAFTLKPRGKHILTVCMGTACHVRGGPAIVETFATQLGISPGETTPDRLFTLETVNCLGACALGPIVVADGHYFSNVKTRMVKDILRKVRDGLCGQDDETGEGIFLLCARCPACGASLLDSEQGLEGQPAILLASRSDGAAGWVRLSACHGRSATAFERKPPEQAEATYACPHCSASVMAQENCLACEAPVASLPVQGGGRLRVCARVGCGERELDVGGAPVAVSDAFPS